MSVKEHEALILKAAENFRIDKNLITAIIIIESSGNQWVTRYEPTWKYQVQYRDFASRLILSDETEYMHQSTSWGLMQVMGSIARELGFTDHLTMLCTPEIGIFYGCKKLQHLLQRYGLEEDAIAAYNAGSAIKSTGGMYINQRYVDKVHAELIKLRQLQ